MAVETKEYSNDFQDSQWRSRRRSSAVGIGPCHGSRRHGLCAKDKGRLQKGEEHEVGQRHEDVREEVRAQV
jgi:hypothetical protein